MVPNCKNCFFITEIIGEEDKKKQERQLYLQKCESLPAVGIPAANKGSKQG